MKSAVTSLGCLMLAVITFIIVSTISSVGIRSDELNTAVDVAMAATQKALLEKRDTITNNEEYIAEFNQNLLVQIDSDSDVEVIVYTADYEKGLLDVEVKEKFRYIFNGSEKTREYSTRRTSIIDTTDKIPTE